MKEESPLKNVELSFICNESWEKMVPNNQGRHCDVCNKTVVDFSNKTKADFDNAMAEANGKLCGRFKATQTIHITQYRFDKAAAIALLATASLSLITCNTDGQVKTGKIKPTVSSFGGAPITPPDTTIKGEAQADTGKPELTVVCTPEIMGEGRMLVGDIAPPPPPPPPPDTSALRDSVVVPDPWEGEIMLGQAIAEPRLMPEYDGGNKAMQNFINLNIRWPEKLDQDVTVYLQLRIDEMGNVSEATVIKSYRKDVDSEALRIAKLLHFNPAKRGGTPVVSYTSIPVKFTRKK